MPSTIAEIEAVVRERLVEASPTYWSSDELTKIIILGIKDLWRSIVDLKAEHYLIVDTTNVSVVSGSDTLQGVPSDVHKVYLIEPIFNNSPSIRSQLTFTPKEYNHYDFQAARQRENVNEPVGEVLYAVTGLGAPIGAPTIRIAPKINANIPLAFSYVPSLESMVSGSYIPVPGESDNALISWTVAYARAKETDDHAPDQAWLGVYATEKQNLLQSLGLRQLQEPVISDGVFDVLW
jgi:hypothetical protein